MAVVLPFDSLGQYWDSNPCKVFLDTNVLFSYYCRSDKFHKEIFDLIVILLGRGVGIYDNVTTRSEFIELQRRMLITESLISFCENTYGLSKNSEIARKLKQLRENMSGEREKIDHSGSMILTLRSSVDHFLYLLKTVKIFGWNFAQKDLTPN